MTRSPVRQTEFAGLLARGKVRDVYDLGDELMIVASDRVSAFDVVMDEPVPGKGRVLTRLTAHWLTTIAAASPHHLRYVVTAERVPEAYAAHASELDGRAMVVARAHVLPIECVVRGYLAGGGWKEYQAIGSISGVALPPGLRLAQQLPAPIFTPSTKAASGHDEPVSFERACASVAAGDWLTPDVARELGFTPDLGRSWMEQARRRSLAIYAEASAYAAARGIILADTKFEFGVRRSDDGEPVLLLIDEVLTPDSSRFWPAEEWRVGCSPPSFDKQFLRDYLETLDWPKRPPPPPIPAEIIARTADRYEQAYRLLTASGVRR